MLELYHFWDSTCSTKVRSCLAEKGVEWISRHVDLRKFEQIRPEYLAINPNARVPALVHDGCVVVESTIINEYIEQAFAGPPLLPGTPLGAAGVRLWVKYADDALYPAVTQLSAQLIMKRYMSGKSPEELDHLARNHPVEERVRMYLDAARAAVDWDVVHAARRRFENGFDRIEIDLSRGAWLAGAQFTLADIALIPLIDRLEFLDLADLWERRAALVDWIGRIKERPSYAASMPPAAQRLPGPVRDRVLAGG